jgi:hypothetical protein
MSQFTAPLLVTPLDDGETWIIVSDDFRYDVGHEGSDDRVEVPQWMATDFASVPRPIWWFAAPWGLMGTQPCSTTPATTSRTAAGPSTTASSWRPWASSVSVA